MSALNSPMSLTRPSSPSPSLCSALARTPVEIWHHIILHVLHSHLFSPLEITHCVSHHRTAWRLQERKHRAWCSDLRLVSKSWKEFIEWWGFRGSVRTTDGVSGRGVQVLVHDVALTIKKEEELEDGEQKSESNPDDYRPSVIAPNAFAIVTTDALAQQPNLKNTNGRYKKSDVNEEEAQAFMEELLEMKSRHMVSLNLSTFYVKHTLYQLPSIAARFQNLVALVLNYPIIMPSISDEDEERAKEEEIHLPNLAILEYKCSLFSVNLRAWNLPSLEHLFIGHIHGTSQGKALIEWLHNRHHDKILGNKPLRTLEWGIKTGRHVDIPKELWTACPKLEILYSDFGRCNVQLPWNEAEADEIEAEDDDKPKEDDETTASKERKTIDRTWSLKRIVHTDSLDYEFRTSTFLRTILNDHSGIQVQFVSHSWDAVIGFSVVPQDKWLSKVAKSMGERTGASKERYRAALEVFGSRAWDGSVLDMYGEQLVGGLVGKWKAWIEERMTPEPPVDTQELVKIEEEEKPADQPEVNNITMPETAIDTENNTEDRNNNKGTNLDDEQDIVDMADDSPKTQESKEGALHDQIKEECAPMTSLQEESYSLKTTEECADNNSQDMEVVNQEITKTSFSDTGSHEISDITMPLVDHDENALSGPDLTNELIVPKQTSD